MHLGRFWLLALGAAAVEGFKDTSPFVFVSTSEYVSTATPTLLLSRRRR